LGAKVRVIKSGDSDRTIIFREVKSASGVSCYLLLGECLIEEGMSFDVTLTLAHSGFIFFKLCNLGQVLFFGLVFIYLFIYFSVLGFKLRAL
jgi:hypothetical protein